MSYDLKIELFCFDAKTDFLPYYKTLKIVISKDSTLLDLIKNLSSMHRGLLPPKNKYLAVRVNNVVTFLNTPIKNIVEKLETLSLTIEPISEYRVVKNLDINTDDFNKKIDYFNEFIDDNDKKEYQKLVSYYYASVVLEFEKYYVGDSLFIFADTLIKKYPEKKKKILEVIANEKFTIWLHVNLKNVLFDDEKADEIESIVNNIKAEILSSIPNISKSAKYQNFTHKAYNE